MNRTTRKRRAAAERAALAERQANKDRRLIARFMRTRIHESCDTIFVGWRVWRALSRRRRLGAPFAIRQIPRDLDRVGRGVVPMRCRYPWEPVAEPARSGTLIWDCPYVKIPWPTLSTRSVLHIDVS